MKDWIPEAVIYQVNLRAFAARGPRNPIEAFSEMRGAEGVSSPLQFVAEHLSQIKELGANVVYVMPPFPMGIEGRKGVGSNYSIRDFRAIEPEYGTMDDFVGLVGRVHELGMKIIVDLTPNHTSRDNVWTSIEGIHCREDDGSLYYDYDWSDTAKLDYTNPRTRHEMQSVLSFWLDVCDGDGVDGFRFDMAHMINDPSFWNEVLSELTSRHSGRDLLFLAESYGVANNRDLFERGMNAAYDDDFYKVCLYGYARDEDGQSKVCLSREAFTNGDFSSKAEAFAASGIAAAFEQALMDYETGSDSVSGPWVARYTDNHDEGRGVYRFGDDAVRAVSRLIFLSGHCLPFLLCGQEFGAANRPTIHDRLKPCDKGYRICGPDCEQTAQVEGVEFEGNLFARGPRARQAWYAFYRDLIELRAAHPGLRRGSTKLCDLGEVCGRHDRTVVAFERQWDGSLIRCAINMGPEPRRLKHLTRLAGDVLYGALADGTLGPFEAVVTLVV
ncbi:MAG: alpha-amylase family glycosyl hydrolase [Kiritimatiellia bacterium]|jgi:glycosidase|nr:alpha-amylase family glycosyl hydrolase [Kiritimatiellia bacterium]MDP6809604.1 alpha-amylase family glycosyl hydrolase [Kiritimatiellia bacterium]MDP7023545.1 alpha-amylase family glycosyl hydrolase [Kiritimatiellia bacterium]